MVKKHLIPEGVVQGRPEHEPTDKDRAYVEVASQNSVKHKAIAAKLGIALNTLRKHYMKELLLGDANVQMAIGQAGMTVALGTKAEYYPMDHPNPAFRGKLARAERPPDPVMLKFLMMTRLGLVPRMGHEHDPFGKPEDLEFNTSGMTNNERMERMANILDAVAERMQHSAPKQIDQPKLVSDGSKSVN